MLNAQFVFRGDKQHRVFEPVTQKGNQEWAGEITLSFIPGCKKLARLGPGLGFTPALSITLTSSV
jgi:hypothetical protein